MKQFEIEKAEYEDLQEILKFSVFGLSKWSWFIWHTGYSAIKTKFTSTLSVDNLRLYEKVGYSEYKRGQVDDMLTLV